MGGTSSKSIVKNSTDQTIGSKLSVLQSTNTSNLCNQIVNKRFQYLYNLKSKR